MTDSAIAFFEGKFVPLSEAKVSVQVHALNYGTAIFEGIRGYYNPERDEIYLFRLAEHFRRMLNNCKLIKVELPYSADDLCDLTVEMVRRNNFHQDIYVRPRTGGPLMSVDRIENGQVSTSWWSGGGFRYGKFPIRLLMGPVAIPPTHEEGQNKRPK